MTEGALWGVAIACAVPLTILGFLIWRFGLGPFAFQIGLVPISEDVELTVRETVRRRCEEARLLGFGGLEAREFLRMTAIKAIVEAYNELFPPLPGRKPRYRAHRNWPMAEVMLAESGTIATILPWVGFDFVDPDGIRPVTIRIALKSEIVDLKAARSGIMAKGHDIPDGRPTLTPTGPANGAKSQQVRGRAAKAPGTEEIGKPRYIPGQRKFNKLT